MSKENGTTPQGEEAAEPKPIVNPQTEAELINNLNIAIAINTSGKWSIPAKDTLRRYFIGKIYPAVNLPDGDWRKIDVLYALDEVAERLKKNPDWLFREVGDELRKLPEGAIQHPYSTPREVAVDFFNLNKSGHSPKIKRPKPHVVEFADTGKMLRENKRAGNRLLNETAEKLF